MKAFILTGKRTVVSLVGDDDPEVDGLFGAEFFVVPLLLDAHSAVGFNRHPWIVVTDLESLSLGFLLELEDVATLGVSV